MEVAVPHLSHFRRISYRREQPLNPGRLQLSPTLPTDRPHGDAMKKGMDARPYLHDYGVYRLLRTFLTMR
jgi:hypothetical protein